MKSIKKKILSVTLSLMMVLLALSPAALAATPQKDTTLKLFYTNDVHGYADPEYSNSGEMKNIGLSRVQGYVDSQASTADGVMLLDAGDFAQGNAFTSVDKGEGISDVMSNMSYAATVPGNHEFDYGLTQLQSIYDKMGTNVVCVNARKDGELLFDPYSIQEIAGLKVGILGVATQQSSEDANKKEGCEGLDFGTKESILNDVSNTTDELKAQGCDLIIALSHIGLADDQDFTSGDIANADPDIDVIIDGHVHQVYNEKCNNTWITSSGSYLDNLGEVDITVASDGTKTINCSTIPASQFIDVTPNSAVQSALDAVNAEHDTILNQVIGYTPVDLVGKGTRKNETNLTKLYTDAMLQATGSDMVLINGGGFRSSIPAGEITKGSILDVTPFDNSLVTLEMTGQQIIDQVQKILSVGSDIPLTSGVQMLVDKEVTTNSEGENDYIKTLISIEKDGQPLDPKATYTVSTFDYLALGGSDYDIMATVPITQSFGSSNTIVEEYIPTADFDKLQQEQYVTFDTSGQYSGQSIYDTLNSNQMSTTQIVLICILVAAGTAIVIVVIVKRSHKNA